MSLVAQRLKASACNAVDLVRSLGREDPLEKEMVTHSSILAWRIPWTRNLAGYSPCGRKESNMTEPLHFHLLMPDCMYSLAENHLEAGFPSKS